MTQLGNITFGSALKDFDKFFVGFDNQFDRMAKLHDDITRNVPSYPPYNIKKTGENTYSISLAVAGFLESQIEIETADNKLIIRGTSTDEKDDGSYLFKGIANRSFIRTFALDDHIEVKGAELLNGMLSVFLERIVPDYKKPRKIEVKTKGEQKLLTE